MNSDFGRLVREVIARRGGGCENPRRPKFRPEAERDLTPLEIVLIALEVEEATGIEVPVDRLALAVTVSDLIQCFDVALSNGSLRNVA